MKPRRLLAVLPAAALALTALVACSSVTPAATGIVNVVAAEGFWGDIVGQIGGAHVKVTSIISDPNTDPHEYESSDKDAVAVATAQLVVENGVGYDDFLSDLVAGSGEHPDVIIVADVLGIGSQDDPNPHLWYDTAMLPKVAGAIADQLGVLDPADRATFAANARTFDASLRPILATIAQIKAKYAGTKIAYTERVPGYLTEAAGLVLGVPVGFTQAVEDGADPSPKDTVAFDDAITSHTVKVLLYNAQVADAQTTQIKQLATSAGVPIVGVTETMPPTYAHFQDWQLAQARALLKALGS